MGVVAFDTYTAAKRLRAAGFDENQAEAAVAMVREEVAEGTGNTENLEAGQAELRTDVAGLKTDVARLEAGQAELRSDVAGLKTDVANLKTDVADLKSDVTDLKVNVTRIESRVERIEAGMATKEDLATVSKETSHNLLRVALALGGIMAVGFSAMLAVLA